MGGGKDRADGSNTSDERVMARDRPTGLPITHQDVQIDVGPTIRSPIGKGPRQVQAENCRVLAQRADCALGKTPVLRQPVECGVQRRNPAPESGTRLNNRPARSTPTTAPVVSRVKKPRCPAP